MNDIERKFNNEMINIYKRADKEIGYRATRFLQMLSEKGGINTAISLVSKEGGTDGFSVLWENKRLDLSVEALVLRDEYKELFSDEITKVCRERLEQYGYSVNIYENRTEGKNDA
jgi:hypothetical protein